jgi:UDP-GlcNAc3NAcA epimerase
MKNILTVIGARPQIIKAAAVSRAIRTKFAESLNEVILHTGQHYDDKMSDIFFTELAIPRPNHQLDVGSGSHGEQTAKMLSGIEKVLKTDKIDALLVYGDTNSTLAGALAAAKMHIPVIHVEAGLRSFNKGMPEEINRITCDHCSTLLFSPTKTGIDNLKNEGFEMGPHDHYTIDRPGVFHCGDVMYDNSIFFSDLASSSIDRSKFEITDGEFALVTIHRPYNTDDIERLNALLEDLAWMSESHNIQLVMPLHPRTKHMLEEKSSEKFKQFSANPNIHVIEPVSFLEMIFLEKNCRLVVTDSGGVQKEAYFFQKPSVVIRTETEWTELIAHGSARLSFETGAAMREKFSAALSEEQREFPLLFGDGRASEFICEMIQENV